MLYIEQSIASRTAAAPEPSAAPAAPFTPATPAAVPAERDRAVVPVNEAACGGKNGSLPGTCAPMAFPYIPMQDMNPKRYDNREALQRGTLFPGLDLPFPASLPPIPTFPS